VRVCVSRSEYQAPHSTIGPSRRVGGEEEEEEEEEEEGRPLKAL